MLHNLDWLKKGEPFPPTSEAERIKRYKANDKFFAGEHFKASKGSLYHEYAKRISRVVDNFSDFVSFPVLLNYQRLMALKTADLVCGEYPTITGKSDSATKVITQIREETDHDLKTYASVIDLCRYGDTIWRIYKDRKSSKHTYTVWDIKDWFPIVSQDGTYTIEKHVLAWVVEISDNEYWDELHVQIHEEGFYTYKVFNISKTHVITVNEDFSRVIGKQIAADKRVSTSIDGNAVIHTRNLYTSGTVFGYDDFSNIDPIIAELMTRIAQVSSILDKHANPSMTGPVSLLKKDPKTKELMFETGDYYGVNVNEEKPQYLTWEGQLNFAFDQVKLLINQLYILSEMGSALLGAGGSESGQAISGTAMRMKMANPLSKARRISNLLTSPTKALIEKVSSLGYTGVNRKDISIVWKDGLPSDPREVVDLAKAATGEPHLMPLKTAIIEYFERTEAQADEWIDKLDEQVKKSMELTMSNTEQEPDGSYKATGSTQSKGSMTGLNDPNRKSLSGSEDK